MSSGTIRSLRRILPLLLAAGCQPATPSTLDAVASSYVTLAQELGERDPDALDFSTAPALTAPARTLTQINRDANALLTQLEALHLAQSQQPRADFLRLQLIAIATRVDLLQGHKLTVDREAERLFATHRLPDTAATHRAEIRKQISSLLPPASDSHTRLADRFAHYDSAFIIPEERVEPVVQAALALCRHRTLEYIDLPPSESVALRLVTHKPWVAFSHYLGNAHSLIEINVDQPLTVDDALELACHEGYPGHHVFNSLRDQQLAAEAHINPTFSPSAYVSEAAAAYAPHLAFTLQERIASERDILFPVAGLADLDVSRYVEITLRVRELGSAFPAIAAGYLDGQLEFARAEQQFADEALTANAAPTLLYLNEYRSYMLAYTDGPLRLAAYLDSTKSPWRAYEGIMRNVWFQLPPAP